VSKSCTKSVVSTFMQVQYSLSILFIQLRLKLYLMFQAGLQALHFAAKSGHLEVACELLKSGASVNAASQVSSVAYSISPNIRPRPMYLSHPVVIE